MTPKNRYTVWVWVDDDGTPVYVGWGPHDKEHPAELLFKNRNNFRSPLNDYLASLWVEPKRISSRTCSTQLDARAYAVILRDDFAKDGVELLSSVAYETRRGGGNPRRVMGPDFTIYRSVRSAARANALDPGTIVYRCNDPSNFGWTYLESEK